MSSDPDISKDRFFTALHESTKERLELRQMMLGNEAIARGAVEAGLDVAAGYPGTPSSEIIGTLAGWTGDFGYHVEWSTNEKVALEVALGAAFAGATALATMKHVGLNVAADALMSAAYTGVSGALVIVVADDPGPHSSQNEQDTRRYGPLSKLPIFDPGTPAEAKEMTLAAFELSRCYGLPVILRPTTRVAHASGPVEVGPVPERAPVRGYRSDPRFVLLPRNAAVRHPWLEEQVDKLRAEFSASPWNVIAGRGSLGIVTGGVSKLYVTEALAALGLEAAVLEIGTPHPFPLALAREFLGRAERILVVEEGDPVLEEGMFLAAAGLGMNADSRGYEAPGKRAVIMGKYSGHLPRVGENTPDLVRRAIADFAGIAETARPIPAVPADLPQRPPLLCAGCSHRSVFYAVKTALKGKDPVLSGDIGCYTLGASAPLNAIETCLCMGGSITLADGMALVEPDRPHIAFIGDSTFLHMGLPGLINAAYNRVRLALIILDNGTTAMTGHQPHPGMGLSATGQPAPAVDLEGLVRACGASGVAVVDAYDRRALQEAVLHSLTFEGPYVIIARRACAAVTKATRRFEIAGEDCTNCRRCLRELGCPALSAGEKPIISEACFGCGLCAEICPQGAINEVKS